MQSFHSPLTLFLCANIEKRGTCKNTAGLPRGGCGKTSSALFTAEALANAGHRVIACDSDANNNLTDALVRDESPALIEEHSLYRALTGLRELAECVIPTKFNLSLIAGTPSLANAALELAQDPGVCMRFPVELKALDTEVIVIDTAPALTLELTLALYAADTVIVPVGLSRWTVAAYQVIADRLRMVTKTTGRPVRLLALPDIVTEKETELLREMNGWTLTRTAIFRGTWRDILEAGALIHRFAMCAAGAPPLHPGDIEAFASTATAERRRRALAIYHLHVQVISRASGVKGERSAVACAAYRAGEKIRDERIGQEFDYTRKKGVEETMILAPEGSPEWVKDRGQLWNQVEAAEIRKDAQLAREMDIALPRELTGEQQRDLIKSYVQEQFVEQGMVADVAIHQGLGKVPNPHEHVMLTMREIHEEGFGNKVREWNDRANLGDWRDQWEKAANRELEKAGS